MSIYLKLKAPANGELDAKQLISELSAKGLTDVEMLPEDKVVIKLSKSEQKAKKALYSTKYRCLDYVIKDKEDKKNDPVYVKKQKEYSSLPEVLARKNVVTAGNRNMFRAVKVRYPEIYAELKREFIPQAVRRARAKVVGGIKKTRRAIRQKSDQLGVHLPTNKKDRRKIETVA